MLNAGETTRPVAAPLATPAVPGYANRGYTLVELLIAIAVVGILIAIALPRLDSTGPDHLTAAAQIVQADLAYGRSLAIENDSHYQFAFYLADNRYVLTHSGASVALATLPDFPYRHSNDTTQTQTTSLEELPFLSDPVRLVAVQRIGPTGIVQKTETVEFGPLGATTSLDLTRIWLSIGVGTESLFVAVDVDPTTGGTTRNAISRTGPAKAIPGGEFENPATPSSNDSATCLPGGCLNAGLDHRSVAIRSTGELRATGKRQATGELQACYRSTAG